MKNALSVTEVADAEATRWNWASGRLHPSLLHVLSVPTGEGRSCFFNITVFKIKLVFETHKQSSYVTGWTYSCGIPGLPMSS